MSLNTSFCSFLTCLHLNISSFVLLKTLSHSARCRLVSVSIFVALVCSTPRVPLLVVDLSRLSQPFLLCVKHLDWLHSLFSCPWRLSKYFYFRWTGSCRLLSPLPVEFLSVHVSFTRAFGYSTFFSSLWIRFLSSCSLYTFVIASFLIVKLQKYGNQSLENFGLLLNDC